MICCSFVRTVSNFKFQGLGRKNKFEILKTDRNDNNNKHNDNDNSNSTKHSNDNTPGLR